ncbi:DUF4118 domain-containing protein [Paraburkholderia sp. MM6662-R1]|uniref:DUF4118 domain-containing protein n=1 Tax=Paraburkholderia sp. MM6662-R1 TaxID=2991066 RepID=UPI003D1C0D79
MAHLHLDLQSRSPILRYGLSVVCVGAALGLALVFRFFGIHDIYGSPFNFAIGVACWYGGVGPSVLAVVLSAASYDYFLSAPLYTIGLQTKDFPRFLVFTAWGLIFAGFVAARRRIETELRHTSDRLQAELQQRVSIKKARFTGSIRKSPRGLSSLKRVTRNCNLSPIPSRTIYARHFAM